jgi:hypothetical protein
MLVHARRSVVPPGIARAAPEESVQTVSTGFSTIILAAPASAVAASSGFVG